MIIAFTIISLNIIGLFIIGIISSRRVNLLEIGSFLFVERKIKTALLAPSVFNSWLWTTSLIGAAEAGITYGISGGLSYALGAGLAFTIVTFIILKLHDENNHNIFIIDFLERRYAYSTRKWYYILSIVISLYIIVEIAAGVGAVFYGLFSVSFKTVAFLAVMIPIFFVQKVGTRGIIFSDLISFFLIIGGFMTLGFFVLKTYDLSYIYEQLSNVKEGTHPVYQNKEALDLLSEGSIKYFITAVLVGVAQLILDPSYYLKASIANSRKTVKVSFLLGGVFFFIPISVMSSIIFGQTFVALGYVVEDGENASAAIATELIKENFSEGMSVLLGVVIFAVGLTTIMSSMLGLMSLASLKICEEMQDSPNDVGRITFGRTFVIVVGSIGALIVISLETISLLTLDIFCGILFSSVAGVIIYSLIKKGYRWGYLPVITILIGAISGLTIWFVTEANWFYGTLVSFLIPLIILFIADTIIGGIQK